MGAWPWVAEVLTAGDTIGEAALWMVEAIVGSAIELGYTPEQAITVYRSIRYYTVGEILVHARTAARHTDPRPTYLTTVFARLDASRLPHLAGLADRWPELAARDTYADGLQALVDGLLNTFASSGGAGPR